MIPGRLTQKVIGVFSCSFQGRLNLAQLRGDATI